MNLLDTEMLEKLNRISDFLAYRNLDKLEEEELYQKTGSRSVDLLILLGNSVLYTIEFAARAYRKGLCNKVMIVGGIGHATEYLRENIRKEKYYNHIITEGKPEAKMIYQILTTFYGIPGRDVIMEITSTNCGANAIEALKVLKKLSLQPEKAILVQDPTMQLRSYASFKKSWKEENTCLLSYAPFIPKLILQDNDIKFQRLVEGIWSIERFISLIIGEIPRLLDNEKGYGPKGKNFIEHVEVPEYIIEDYKYLLDYLNSDVLNRIV